MSELYTSSRLKVFRQCMHKHWLRYELGLRGPETNAMRFGTLAHAALEAYFRMWQLAGADAQGAFDGRLNAALQALRVCVDDVERAKLTTLVTGYHARWGASPWEVIAVEQEFRFDLGGYEIGGKVDAIVRDTTDGRVYVLEHKTTASDATPGSAYWARLALDTQVSIYIDGATVLGYEIAGVIYDVLTRPSHERKLATPDADRKYTVGKGCKICGGSLQGKQGTGKSIADPTADCSVCQGTGWRLADGKPEAPKLYANQRAEDETIEAFAERVTSAIADAPDDFYRRGDVQRLDDELVKMRASLLETIKLERLANLVGLRPANPDACASYGSLCPFFPICAGQASADDEIRFPRGPAHPELAA